ncbi:MAG: sortase [Ruminococcus sp.]|nr:sortase [Ruminococcus sp.]
MIGSLLLLAAAILIFCNIRQDKKSGERSREVLEVLEVRISDEAKKTDEAKNLEQPSSEQKYTAPAEDLFAQYGTEDATAATQEKLAEIDGDSYVGIISIPRLGVRLPVMSEWSYANLKISPCRYSGRADTDDIIIAAHNYSSHFGNIADLLIGDEMIFIAADGIEYRYTVTQTDTLDGTDVEGLVANDSSSWDLTLFTCTLSGQSRVCVRAEKADASDDAA